jgi:cell division GTPase FtsZ
LGAFDRTWCWSKSDVGQQSAIEFQIEKMFGYKMVFITAGMGGGTELELPVMHN